MLCSRSCRRLCPPTSKGAPQSQQMTGESEPKSSVKSPSGIGDAGGGALELAHREGVAGSGLPGLHGGSCSRPGLPGRSARGIGGHFQPRCSSPCLRAMPADEHSQASQVHPCGLRRLQPNRSQQALWLVQTVALQLHGFFSWLLLSRPPAPYGTRTNSTWAGDTGPIRPDATARQCSRALARALG